ncbi:MAG: NTP transferase domain-containing protein, partial [Candidatus Binatia bacterium]
MSEAELASRFISGLVLAAGGSTRMGRPKQLLPLGETCLLQRVIDQALESRLDEVVVVLGHRASEILEALKTPTASRVRFAVNDDHAEGLSTSLITGLRALDPRTVAAAVILGDQPGVGATLIDRTIAAFLASDRSVARPVYVSRGGGDPVKVP